MENRPIKCCVVVEFQVDVITWTAGMTDLSPGAVFQTHLVTKTPGLDTLGDLDQWQMRWGLLEGGCETL